MSVEDQNSLKLKAARAQLGTALSLFIHDMDPISVQVLACGGGEVIEGLARAHSLPTLTEHIQKTYPDVKIGKIKAIRNENWNAFKHYSGRGGDEARDDLHILGTFDDTMNDAVLFLAWTDYLALVGKLPVEAQAFLAWYYAAYPEKLANEKFQADYQSIFPNLPKQSRKKQKRRLRQQIEEFRNEVQADVATEREPLIAANTYLD
ncbi:hypothetical protein [Rhizobium metallidurans]|uniref:Uncharacterized protein n=1 Tax=Rhizobium metallidurans TaxID=1265931 RepID=A0A7W6CRR1_9HYPH|nr:hypothetical protein [Rhizobium metallidurans]MBB3965970.1 hypothetical protein [Rhizobium metallidurans]